MSNEELKDILEELREAYRTRTDYVKTMQGLQNRMNAVVRRKTGAVAGHAPKVVKACLENNLDTPIKIEIEDPEDKSRKNKKKIYGVVTPELLRVIASNIVPINDAQGPLKKHRGDYEKRMIALAKRLPVWEWVKDHAPGLGDLGFSQIIAECGDLTNYANPAKLWKRMGLGIVDGEAQRKYTDPEKALKHGYSPRRRSVMWNIGTSVIKLGRGKYRELYDVYKEYQTEKSGEELSKMHIHLRAQRYMEKRILRDLWQAWRDYSEV